MKDPTSFWLIAGAAAPIIALASVVTFGDASFLQHFFKYQIGSLAEDRTRLDWAKHGRSRIWIVLVGSYINLSLQALVLGGGFVHFAYGTFKGKESFALVSFIEVYGIVVVALSVFWTGSARNSKAQVESEHPVKRDRDERDQASSGTAQKSPGEL